jgi:nucleoside-diphosphate-sugar epimerase
MMTAGTDVSGDERAARGEIDTAYRGVPALVLGGTGFIGAWTARVLHRRGAHVTVTARDPARVHAALGELARQVEIVVADLEVPDSVARVVESATPAVVFNLAGYGVDRTERDPAHMSALNANLVAELCRSLAHEPHPGWSGARLVHVGSALEYGRLDPQRPLVEAAEVNPTTEYGRTKLRGTRLVERASVESGLRAVIARLFTVYGPGEHAGRLLPALMDTARTRTRLALTAGTQRRDFTYVEDAVEGLLRLGLDAGTPAQIVNVATGRLTTVREFAEIGAGVLGLDPALLDFGALPDRDDEMWQGEVDVSRLRRLTSWTPSTSIAEGIRRSTEHLDAG